MEQGDEELRETRSVRNSIRDLNAVDFYTLKKEATGLG